jgi:DNA invertase Pin-like site-specific DNA recombinase
MTTQTPAKAYGYIRVSTAAQSLDRQHDALTGKGIALRDIYSDKVSGARESRPGLDELLRHVRAGDSITVHSLDRLGRTALHVLTTIADLTEKGIAVRSLKDGEDLTSTTGKLLAGIIVHIAEWERSMNAERVAEARAARTARAKAGEQVAGRPRTAMLPATIKAVHSLKASGMGAAEIAKNQKISRASVYRALTNTSST